MNSGHRGHREEPRVLIEEEVRILPSMGRAGRRRPPPRQHPQDHAGTEPRGDGDAGSRDTHAPERPAALASRPRTPPAWASCCRGPAVGHPTLPGKPAEAAFPAGPETQSTRSPAAPEVPPPSLAPRHESSGSWEDCTARKRENPGSAREFPVRFFFRIVPQDLSD